MNTICDDNILELLKLIFKTQIMAKTRALIYLEPHDSVTERVRYEASDMLTHCKESSNPVRDSFFIIRPAVTLKQNLPPYLFCGLLWFKQIVGPGLCFENQHETLLTLRLNCRLPGKPWNQQGVQGKKMPESKKRSLRSVAHDH